MFWSGVTGWTAIQISLLDTLIPRDTIHGTVVYNTSNYIFMFVTKKIQITRDWWDQEQGESKKDQGLIQKQGDIKRINAW